MKKFLICLIGLLFMVGIILVAGGCEAECGGAISAGFGCFGGSALLSKVLEYIGAFND